MENCPAFRKRAQNAVLYVATQGALGPSAQDQRSALVACATYKGLDIVGCFEDQQPASRAAILERPGLLGAIETLRRHAGGVLVFACRAIIPASVDLSLVLAMVDATGPRSHVLSAVGPLTRPGPDRSTVLASMHALVDWRRFILRDENDRDLERLKATRGWPPEAQ